MKPPTYRFSEPPPALKKAQLDNIALVPASLLPLKETYQPIANRLPKGSILCVQSQSPRQRKILAQVVQFFRSHGHTGITMPIEKIGKRIQTPPLKTANLPLAF